MLTAHPSRSKDSVRRIDPVLARVAGLTLVLALSSPVPRGARAADPRFAAERHAFIRGESVTLPLEIDEGDEVAFDVSGWLPRKIAVRDGRAQYALETAGLHAGD